MRMAPFTEMPLEGFTAHVDVPTAYFTLMLDPESMEFEKPVRDRFSVPAHWEFKGIVERIALAVFFIVRDLDLDWLFCCIIEPFFFGECLFPLNVRACILTD